MHKTVATDREASTAPDNHLVSLIAQCWASQTLLLLATLTLALMQSAIRDDFTIFLLDPGQRGWTALCMVLALFAVMPLLVRAYDRRWFRRINIALMLVTVLIPVAHHVKHILEGRYPDFNAVPEAAAVLVGIFGVALSLRWARQSHADESAAGIAASVRRTDLA